MASGRVRWGSVVGREMGSALGKPLSDIGMLAQEQLVLVGVCPNCAWGLRPGIYPKRVVVGWVKLHDPSFWQFVRIVRHDDGQ